MDTNSIWFLKEQDKANYDKMFKTFDTNSSNSLTSAQMQQVMMMTKLEPSVCG